MKGRFARKVVSLGEKQTERMDEFPAHAEDPNMHINYFGGMKL